MFAIAVVAMGVLLAVVAFVLTAWKRQEWIVFQPPRFSGLPSVDCPSVSFQASDGQNLIAFVVGDAAKDPGIIIAFHGNAVEAHTQIPWAREVHQRTGWCVFLPEYRGYAGLGGEPSYLNSKLDSGAAYEAATRLNTGRSTLFAFFGHSLGTAIAVELAVEKNPVALILQSPLTSARDMARIILFRPMIMLWKIISRVHYDTESIVRTLDVPVWVAHGRRDMITPVSMGRRIHSAALRKGSLLIVEGAAHNDVDARGGPEYWNWFSDALNGERSLR